MLEDANFGHIDLPLPTSPSVCNSAEFTNFLRWAEGAITGEFGSKAKKESSLTNNRNSEGLKFLKPSDAVGRNASLQSSTPSLLQELRVPPVYSERFGYDRVVATCWSSQGNVLALSLGPSSTRAELGFASVILFYTLSDDTSKPGFGELSGAKLLGFAECKSGWISSLAFHPQSHGLLAAGTYIGQVILFTANDDTAPINPQKSGEEQLYSPLLQSPLNQYDHQGKVTQLHWMQMPTTRSWQLCSAGLDGRLLIWDPLNSSLQLNVPTLGTAIKAGDLVRGSASGLATLNRGDSIGITSFVISPSNVNEFLVGTTAGAVLKMSRDRFTVVRDLQLPRGSARVDESCEDPVFPKSSNAVTVLYETLDLGPNPIVKVCFSQFNSQLFLCCAQSGEIFLFRDNQTNPLRCLFPENDQETLIDALWSPVKPSVLLSISSARRIIIYDWEQVDDIPLLSFSERLGESKAENTAKEPDEPVTVNANLFSLSVSGTQSSILTLSEGSRVQIWQLAASCNASVTNKSPKQIQMAFNSNLGI